ncbi:MAG: HisA/HisF-related TIM barrel protein, partial [Porticoccaceae bacterium]|nr:HisA/HisF-related TIM barrel protein [Porticoccaceae bacterium]
MLRTRVMPSLLLKNGGLVKTVRFTDDQYVGDPLNAVRIYNQKEVDELVIYDISKTTEGKGIDFDLIEKIASQCFMPVCYGG